MVWVAEVLNGTAEEVDDIVYEAQASYASR